MMAPLHIRFASRTVAVKTTVLTRSTGACARLVLSANQIRHVCAVRPSETVTQTVARTAAAKVSA